MLTLSTLDINEIDRKCTSAEVRRSDVTLSATEVRALLVGYVAPQADAATAARVDLGEALRKTRNAIRNIEAELYGIEAAERAIDEAMAACGIKDKRR